LRALASELTLAEQRERQRLATELHDYLAQLLVLSKMKLVQARQQATIQALTKAVRDVQQIMDQAMIYTRTLVAQLSPPFQGNFDFPIALRWLAQEMRVRDLTVSIKIDRQRFSVSESQAILLFQSVRELLMNVVKHGRTDHAQVTMTEADGVLRLAVIDEGAGFELPAIAEKTSRLPSFGLFSIRERMLAMGGNFSIISAPGQGTTATLELPLIGSEKSSGGVS
jgi:signal transduction histidine kinase